MISPSTPSLILSAPKLFFTCCIFFSTLFSSRLLRAESEKSIERVTDPVESRKGDGAYGRFNGDLSLDIGLGAEANFRSGYLQPLLIGGFMVYQTLGLYSSFRESVNVTDPLQRTMSLGASLSPLFIWRWSNNWESLGPFLDLTLDSLAVHLGAQLSQPRDGHFAEENGLELGLSLGLPLLNRADGLWLRTRGNLSYGRENGVGSIWLYLSWQGFVEAGIFNVD